MLVEVARLAPQAGAGAGVRGNQRSGTRVGPRRTIEVPGAFADVAERLGDPLLLLGRQVGEVHGVVESLVEERHGFDIGEEHVGVLPCRDEVLPRRAVRLGQVVVGREQCRLFLNVDSSLQEITDAGVELPAAAERNAFVDGLAKQVVPEAEHPRCNGANQRAQTLPAGRVAGRASEHGAK